MHQYALCRAHARAQQPYLKRSWARSSSDIYIDQDLKYTWKEALEIAAKVQGGGTNYSRRICKWVMGFVKLEDFP